jgi:hypothetical protein
MELLELLGCLVDLLEFALEIVGRCFDSRKRDT